MTPADRFRAARTPAPATRHANPHAVATHAPRRRAPIGAAVALSVMVPLAGLAAGDPSAQAPTTATPATTTLPPEPTVTVSVGATGAGASPDAVPEVKLIEQQVLGGLPVIAFAGNARWQNWTVRAEFMPDFLAQRLSSRLMVAGFHTAPTCPGHAWSGTHGNRRVDLLVVGKVVEMSMVPALTPCLESGRK